ncbi:hypothetical protein JTE90_015407 [Oedothorax gibbosus]|uniref:GH18 domain-containing protein n=1 Tax=Oedothorax gibbosus TaxID=931172 RepID=A0AAV6U7Y9_9ARAC|nr:hypothetical protein JTE90_015407 [Oedothorax gibbosus]
MLSICTGFKDIMRLLGCSFVVCSLIFPVLCKNNKEGNSELLRVCYYPVDKDNLTPSKLNTTLCTHIIAGFSSVEDGVINLGDDSKKQLYRETTGLKKNNPKLKVLLTIGGGGNNSGFSPAYNSTFNRTKFIASTLAILDEYNFDGLDVDWEFPVWNDACPEDKDNFVYFLEEFHLLSKAYAYLLGKDPAILSVAVAAPVNIVQSSYNIKEMAKYVTFINLMTYDFHDFNWYTPFTGHNSPLFNRSAEKAYFATLNTAWVANYWFEQGMPKSKIMVGIPTYGHSYKLISKNFNGVDAPSSGTNGDVTFTQVCQTLKAGGTRVFDNESKVPYVYLDYDWMSYEDSESMFGKANWIKAEGFGGAMTYDLNADDWPALCDKTPFLLHRILYEVFTT